MTGIGAVKIRTLHDLPAATCRRLRRDCEKEAGGRVFDRRDFGNSMRRMGAR
jgi:hypothetical protein